MILIISLLFTCLEMTQGAVVAPPWANPAINPCALKPRGWQMLYWPHDRKCYRIFKMGHPCPATMELTPGKDGGPAECRCPPGTIHMSDSVVCYPIYQKGPCPYGEYFAPENSVASRIGTCKTSGNCSDLTQIFWPVDGRCYRKMTKGPCLPGNLIALGPDGFAICTCNGTGDHVWENDGRCYEHYTKGPCPTGALFLPGGRCGCTTDLPHYHDDLKACYEIGSIGPCNVGHRFALSAESPHRAQCQCKPNYVLWPDGACYRIYTRGPCGENKLLSPSVRCVNLPCRKTRLYFPSESRCFRIGLQGPCPDKQVVLFDFEARPSIDGIAYNGVCGCLAGLTIERPDDCLKSKLADGNCEQQPGMAIVNGMCYMLYTKGPCKDGQWLIPKHNTTANAECACKPGYNFHSAGNGTLNGVTDDLCVPPAVSLAQYLNETYRRGR